MNMIRPILAAACLCGLTSASGMSLIDFDEPAFTSLVSPIFSDITLTVDGVTITIDRLDSGDLAIFDSNIPGGSDSGDDEDLGSSPLSGLFNGSVPGDPFFDLGNVLIGQRGSSSVPNDDPGGTIFEFTFDPAVGLKEIGLIDTGDTTGGGTVSSFDSDGVLIETLVIPSSPDNSIDILTFVLSAEAETIEVDLGGSGAISFIAFQAVPEPAFFGALGGLVLFGTIVRRRMTRPSA